MRVGTVYNGVHAAPLHSCKYRWLHAPATKDTCRQRSSDCDDLFVCTVAPGIAAKFPRSSIWIVWPASSGVSTMEFTRQRQPSLASDRHDQLVPARAELGTDAVR
jgi:hypothetical protein